MKWNILMKKYGTSICFSLIFSMVNVIASYWLSDGDHTKYDKTVALPINLIAVFCLTVFFYNIIKKYAQLKLISDTGRNSDKNEHKYFWCVFGGHMICYLPVFLAYFPGLFAYDIHRQLPQTIGSYSTHHPLVHTLFMKFFYDVIGVKLFDSPNVGIALAVICQMVILSWALSFIHLYFLRKCVNVIARIVMIVISSCLPVFSMLVIATTKDTLFAAFVGVLFVCILYWENEPERYKSNSLKLLFILSIIIVTLFRNNGFYVVIGTFVLACFLKRFRKNRSFLKCTLLGVLIAIVISKGLTVALDAEKGSSNEMLSVPYQQMAAVYNAKENELSESEKEQILKLLPDVEHYHSYTSDSIKQTGTGFLYKKEFVETWGKLLVKYPKEYLKAFVLLNAGYLYVWDETNAQIYGASPEARQGFLLSDTKPGFDVVHISCFPQLENVYEYLFTTNHYQQIYILKVLCSLSIYLWMIVLSLFYIVDFKQRNMIISTIFLVLLILTILAGPCALARYALPYIICAPVLFVSVFASPKIRRAEKVLYNAR